MNEVIASQVLAVANAQAETHEIHTVEGDTLSSPAVVKILAEGESMILLEVYMPEGGESPPHTHDHESVGYVVSGQVTSIIDGVTHDMGPGDGFRHPPKIVHNMKAGSGGAVWLEIKSPPSRTW